MLRIDCRSTDDISAAPCRTRCFTSRLFGARQLTSHNLTRTIAHACIWSCANQQLIKHGEIEFRQLHCQMSLSTDYQNHFTAENRIKLPNKTVITFFTVPEMRCYTTLWNALLVTTALSITCPCLFFFKRPVDFFQFIDILNTPLVDMLLMMPQIVYATEVCAAWSGRTVAVVFWLVRQISHLL